MFRARVGAQSTRVDIHQINRRAIENNVSAFGGIGRFRRDNRPKIEKTAAEKAQINKIKLQQNQNLDNFYSRRAQQQANISASNKINQLRTNETRKLLGAAREELEM